MILTFMEYLLCARHLLDALCLITHSLLQDKHDEETKVQGNRISCLTSFQGMVQ